MLMMRYAILCLLISFISTLGHARQEDSCKDREYRIVGDFLKSKGFRKSYDKQTGVISSDCKMWPYNKNYTITTFGYVPSKASNPEEDRKIIFISLIDNKSRKVVSSYWEELYEDAQDSLDSHSLKLDTARYQLDERTRAIGLRYSSAAVGARCGDAGSENQLTLFVINGSRLQPVFKRYMRNLRAIKGCIGIATDGDEIEVANLTVSIGDKSHNGYKDLLITASFEDDTRGKEEVVLQFDGRKYLIPKQAPWWLGGADWPSL